ncbi:MAG: helix-turn-helix domain-containing protein [Deltaproteobacteria bacterium]|nr:helix-turn-helix domain-containing protein [Deltaproteobacteria bacterium]
MRFKGKVWKKKKFWLVEIPALDVMTQGRTKKEALQMIADAIEVLVDQPGFKVEVHSGSGKEIEVGSENVGILTALFLQRRRQASGLTLAEAANRLGVKSHNAYARYEQGKSVPTIEKLVQLLSAVDADHNFVIGQSHF